MSGMMNYSCFVSTRKSFHVAMNIISRKEARAQNLKFYYTGVPCVHGHVSHRRVSNTLCLDCSKANNLAWREENPSYGKDWRDAQGNYETIRKERNPEYYAQIKSKWRINNRERDAESTAQWRKNNPDKLRGLNANSKKIRRERTPPWADLSAIRQFYNNCPDGYEVDHIVPLRGKYVSGLHVIGNLQYLPEAVNRAKSNKFDATAGFE
jgi:hypothetical protein